MVIERLPGPLSMPYDAAGSVAVPDLLILQMGKVGSSTAEATIRHALPEISLLRLHMLSEETCDEVSRWCRDTSLPSWWIESALIQVGGGRAARRVLEESFAGERSRGIRLITMTRDPVAYSVSSFFENIEAIVPGAVQAYNSGTEGELCRVLDYFIREAERFCGTDAPRDGVRTEIVQFGFRWPEVFFERELRESLGWDCLSLGFSPGSSHAVYGRDREEFLVVRFEGLFHHLARTLEDFLGSPVPCVVSANDSREKPYAALYHAFLAELRLPDRFIDKLYSTAYVRHFYSEDELAGFAAYWRGNRNAN